MFEQCSTSITNEKSLGVQQNAKCNYTAS